MTSFEHEQSTLSSALKRMPRLFIFLMVLFCWLPAFAQSEEEQEALGMLEEVTVTAQRRAESLQEVPISVTVFDEEELREAGVRILSDISTRTPGFAMGTFNFGQPQL